MNGTIYFVRRGKGCWGEVDHCEQDPREVGRGVLYPSCWWQYLEQPHNELDDSVTLRCIYSSWMEGRLGMLPWSDEIAFVRENMDLFAALYKPWKSKMGRGIYCITVCHENCIANQNLIPLGMYEEVNTHEINPTAGGIYIHGRWGFYGLYIITSKNRERLFTNMKSTW